MKINDNWETERMAKPRLIFEKKKKKTSTNDPRSMWRSIKNMADCQDRAIESS